MDNEPIRREPMYERKRPSTPPPGAVANPNVAKYPEYVENHIIKFLFSWKCFPLVLS
jgi:hypothetical protein